MKLAIFGGTGRTGQHLVQQALDMGHSVMVLARTPSKMTVNHPNLTIIEGDIQDAARVEEVIADADAVLSVLGPSSNKPVFAVSKGMKNILNAMQTHQVERLIMSAGAGVPFPQDKPNFIDRIVGFLLRIFSKNVVEDMLQTVELVRNSETKWTIARAPMLTDNPLSNKWQIGYLGADNLSIRLARADLAAFMLSQLNDETFIHDAPVVTN